MRKRPAVSGLERHYVRIAGQLQELHERILAAGAEATAIESLREEIASRRETLRCITVCLRLFESDWQPERVVLKRPRRSRSPLPRRELMNVAWPVLRAAEEPISTREIMRLSSLQPRGGLTVRQSQDRELMTALTVLLRGQEERGSVAAFGRRPIRWQIIKAPGQRGAAGASASVSDA